MDIPSIHDLINFRFYDEWKEEIEEKDEIGAIKTLNNSTAALEATFNDTQRELFKKYKWAVNFANNYRHHEISDRIMYVAIRIGMQLQKAFEPE